VRLRGIEARAPEKKNNFDGKKDSVKRGKPLEK